jgi:hypothetical protein
LKKPNGKFGCVLDLKRVADNPDYIDAIMVRRLSVV